MINRTYNGCLEYVSTNGNHTVRKLHKNNMTENSVDCLEKTEINYKKVLLK